ncbi:MAG: NF038132 family protein, partial [Paracoccus sp. (in: a-proteobacteria)]
YVSTVDGVDGVGALPGVGGDGDPTSGSVVTTNSFTAAVGESLEFFFNYVTSDGAGYADYGWARLLDSTGNQAALLFTARTTPGGSSVPGFGMPAPEATLTPDTVSIYPGTVWDVLGVDDSGDCYATGCGHTGWVQSTYAFTTAGEYKLQFGVTNWSDTAYDSGMAFAGAKVGNVIITPPPSAVPLPASGVLLVAGMGAIAAIRRRKRA